MLDELVDVIETLKSRINEHRAVLQGNEAQTRFSLRPFAASAGVGYGGSRVG